MSDVEKKHLFVLGYPDRAAADAAVAELHELQRDQFLEVKDWAIVSKAEGGELTVSESKDADPGARRGWLPHFGVKIFPRTLALGRRLPYEVLTSL